jgi:hypothetical protein
LLAACSSDLALLGLRACSTAAFKWQPLRAAVGIPDTRHLAAVAAVGPLLPRKPPAVLLPNKPREM